MACENHVKDTYIMYNIVDYEQGTSEWLNWRKTVMTASNVASAVGRGFDNPLKLYLKYKGKISETPENAAMTRGKNYEPHVRRFLEEKYKLSLLSPCVVNIAKPWIGASLDGLDLNGDFFAEIKIPGKKVHEAVRNGTLREQVEKYYIQVQWQYMALGFLPDGNYTKEPKAIFASGFGVPFGDMALPYSTFLETAEVVDTMVLRDPEYQKNLLCAADKFWNLLNRKDLPAKELIDIVEEFDYAELLSEGEKAMSEASIEEHEREFMAKKAEIEMLEAQLAKAKRELMRHKGAMVKAAEDHIRKNKRDSTIITEPVEVGSSKLEYQKGKLILSEELMIMEGLDPEKFKIRGAGYWAVKSK